MFPFISASVETTFASSLLSCVSSNGEAIIVSNFGFSSVGISSDFSARLAD